MKMFQIYEEDLAALEHTLPEILGSMYPQLTPRLKTQWARVKEIVANVRWNYGPPIDVLKMMDEDGTDPKG